MTKTTARFALSASAAKTWNFGRQVAPTGMPRRQPEFDRGSAGQSRENGSRLIVFPFQSAADKTDPIATAEREPLRVKSTGTNQNRGFRGDSESDFVELGVFAHFC